MEQKVFMRRIFQVGEYAKRSEDRMNCFAKFATQVGFH